MKEGGRRDPRTAAASSRTRRRPGPAVGPVCRPVQLRSIRRRQHAMRRRDRITTRHAGLDLIRAAPCPRADRRDYTARGLEGRGRRAAGRSGNPSEHRRAPAFSVRPAVHRSRRPAGRGQQPGRRHSRFSSSCHGDHAASS